MSDNHDAIITKAGNILKQNQGESTFCVISQLDLDGYPTSSSITLSNVEGIKTLFFCTGLESNKVKRIKKDKRTSVCVNSNDFNITLIGRTEIVTDPFIKNVMWYKGLSGHFSGPNDPNYCVLKFVTERYSLLIDWEEAIGHI